MTAVVAILNMSAVAIAADSAVTVTNEKNQKIFNNANKIFQLSKYHPVGLSIYGSGSLMFTPWEVVIKTYRNKLGNKSFDTITQYQEDFLSYIQSNGYFSSQIGFESKVALTVSTVLTNFFNSAQQLIIGPNPADFYALPAEGQKELLRNSIKEQLRLAANLVAQVPPHKGNYGHITQLDLLSEVKGSASYHRAIQEHYVIKNGYTDAETSTLLENYLYHYFLSSDFSHSVPTGLVFVGYGDKQLYPQCHCIEIAEVLKGKLRWKEDVNESIGDSKQAAILAFAQTDVIETIISGLSPEMDNELGKQITNMLGQHNQQVANLIESANPALAQQLRNGFNINNLLGMLGRNMADYQANFPAKKTHDSVRLFSKEDLTELAESLIYLTYLKRRMTSEQESVGKPVDVAVISKGDGFIWIKRKFYFDPNLNPHFLRNHFRE